MLKWYRATNKACLRLFSTLAVLGIFSQVGFALGPGEIFITNWSTNSVTVYSRTANGSPTPTRTIMTGLVNPFGVVLDPLHAEDFVASTGVGRQSAIQVYDWFANYPNDTPKRTISGPATGLLGLTGLTYDILRDEIYAANEDSSTICVFSRSSNGNVSPKRQIVGPATLLAGPNAISLDLLHDQIIVANQIIYNGGAGRITTYPRSANGNVPPVRDIEGPGTGLNLPVGMDLDLLHDEIVIANSYATNIVVYHRTDNGNVAPLRTLGGPHTGLCMPFDVIDDIVNNELVVVDSGFNFYTMPTLGCNEGTSVYSRTANGDVAPKRAIVTGPPGGAPNPVMAAETLISF